MEYINMSQNYIRYARPPLSLSKRTQLGYRPFSLCLFVNDYYPGCEAARFGCQMLIHFAFRQLLFVCSLSSGSSRRIQIHCIIMIIIYHYCISIFMLLLSFNMDMDVGVGRWLERGMLSGKQFHAFIQLSHSYFCPQVSVQLLFFSE